MRIIVIVLLVSILSGCGGVPYFPEPFGTINYKQKNDGAYLEVHKQTLTLAQRVVSNKPNPIVDITSISRYQKVQGYYLQEFAKMSADYKYKIGKKQEIILEYANPAVIETNSDGVSERKYNISWKLVAASGINFVDAVCHDYLRQINRLKKNTKGLKRLTVNSGYATAEILALTLGASANPSRILGILASAFGLGAGVFDIYEDTILFHAEFSGIYTMLDILKDKQRVQIAGVTNRAQAVQAIQDYLYICSPHAIEAAINAKIGGKISNELVQVLGVSDFTGRGAAEQLSELVKNQKLLKDALGIK